VDLFLFVCGAVCAGAAGCGDWCVVGDAVSGLLGYCRCCLSPAPVESTGPCRSNGCRSNGSGSRVRSRCPSDRSCPGCRGATAGWSASSVLPDRPGPSPSYSGPN